MARTQAADYDQRREQIAVQAAHLYARSGFLGASVSDLAEACGLSKSAIYHYYAAKEDILFEVMHSHVTALDLAARVAIACSDDPKQQLRALSRGFMRLYVGAAERHKVLLNDLQHLPPARRAEIVAVQRGLIGMVERLLTAIEPKLAGLSAARAAAMLFFGMINWTHTWFDPRGAVSAEALGDMAVDVVLGGLAKAAH